MNPLLAQFIPEARDLLDRASNGVLALEREHGAREVVDDVFRAVHTLKGSSGLFDITPLTRLVHAAEDLLDEVRGGDLELNSDIVDSLLNSLDLVGRWISALESEERLPGDAEATGAEHVRSLRAWVEPEQPAARPGASAPSGIAPPSWLLELHESDRLAAFMIAGGRKLTAWTFDPEEDCFFRGDDPIGAVRNSPGLLVVRARASHAIGPLDSLDPLQCWLRFETISDALPATIEQHMRYVADRVAAVAIDADDLAVPTGASASGPMFRDFARLARQHLAAGDLSRLSSSVAALLGMTAAATLEASALRWCDACLKVYGLERPHQIERLIAAVEAGGTPAAENGETSPVTPRPDGVKLTSQGASDARKIALEQIAALETPCAPEISAGRLESAARVLGATLVSLGRSAAPLEPALAAAKRDGDLAPVRTLLETLFPPEAETRAAGRSTPDDEAPRRASTRTQADAKSVGLPRVLRVDQGKIDAIMNLVAELIVAKNSLNYLADRAEKAHGSRAMAREIRNAHTVFDRITQGLQVGVHSVDLTQTLGEHH